MVLAMMALTSASMAPNNCAQRACNERKSRGEQLERFNGKANRH